MKPVEGVVRSWRNALPLPLQSCDSWIVVYIHRGYIQHNRHIFVDLPSIRRLNSTWKVRRDFINFESRVHVEIMTSIRRGNFNRDWTFKIDKLSISFPGKFLYIVSMSNQFNWFIRCFISIIFEHFLLWEPILS